MGGLQCYSIIKGDATEGLREPLPRWKREATTSPIIHLADPTRQSAPTPWCCGPSGPGQGGQGGPEEGLTGAECRKHAAVKRSALWCSCINDIEKQHRDTWSP